LASDANLLPEIINEPLCIGGSKHGDELSSIFALKVDPDKACAGCRMRD
jgi:hypothetical protein